jgi:hypothetical protein
VVVVVIMVARGVGAGDLEHVSTTEMAANFKIGQWLILLFFLICDVK